VVFDRKRKSRLRFFVSPGPCSGATAGDGVTGAGPDSPTSPSGFARECAANAVAQRNAATAMLHLRIDRRYSERTLGGVW
jgi:hypothetical protein